MTTEKQIRANRRNAKKSTGPRTRKGKARSSQNAVTHGLSAESVLLPGEDPEEYARYAEEMRAKYRPQSPVARDLVERLISYGWRWRRAGCYESYLIRAAIAEREEQRKRGDGYYANLPPLEVSRATALLLTQGHAFDKLARYEAALVRGYFRCLEALEEEQQGQENAGAENGTGVAPDREPPQGERSEREPAGSEAEAEALEPLATEA
jgi:hypothetical protein